MAMTVLEPAQVPGAFQQAFHLMRSGRPGPVLIDLPFDVQMAEIDFDPDTYEPLPGLQAGGDPGAGGKALDMLAAAQRPLIVAGGGIINADAADLLVEFAELLSVPVIPTLMGWGTIPDNHPLMAGMVGLQTSHRYGNATMLASDFVLGIGNRWANRHTGGLDVYRAGRTFVHVDIEPTQIGRVFAPDYGIVSDARAALDQLVEVARERAGGRRPGRPLAVGRPDCQERKRTMQRRTHFENVPIKPQRVYEEMNKAFGPEHPLRLHHRPVPDRRPRSSCTCSSRGTGSTPGRPARWAGRCRPPSGCAPPTRTRPWSRCPATTTSSS